MSKKRRELQEVFLSHSSKDRRFVSELADVVRGHGITVWYSEKNLKGAQQWHDEIGRALERCNWFVVVLSKSAVVSPWVKRELLYALQQPRYENRIVPVMLRECDATKLSWTLPSVQFVDFTTDKLSGYQELLRIWGVGYDPRRRAE